MPSRLPALFTAAAVALLPVAARAGEGDFSREGGKAPATVERDPFARGRLELQVLTGVIFSQQRTTDRRPNVDYALGVVRLGLMLDNPYGRGCLRGNDEALLEAIGGGIFQGPGNGLGGLSLLYRHNFLGFGRRAVPFVDLGVGGVYSDAYHVHPQRALGSPGEFDLQAGLGVRFPVGAGWSIDAEADYRHLSNAGLASRNYGTNGIGGIFGFSKAF